MTQNKFKGKITCCVQMFTYIYVSNPFSHKFKNIRYFFTPLQLTLNECTNTGITYSTTSELTTQYLSPSLTVLLP